MGHGKGLRKGQVWQGKDGTFRQVKSIIGLQVSYRVKTVTSKAYDNAAFIGEANLIEADYFQRNFAIKLVTEKELDI